MGTSRLRIFVNYRREETSGHAGRLYDALAARFGHDRVFMDIDRIEPGLDFAEVIDEAVASSDVVIAIVGPRWLSVVDGKGRPRLEHPDDFVRLELAAALTRGVRVIPALVQSAEMPNSEELPQGLESFARRHALELSDTRWSFDVSKLIGVLERLEEQLDPEPEPEPVRVVEPVVAAVEPEAAEREEPPAVAAEAPPRAPAHDHPVDDVAHVREVRTRFAVGAAAIVAVVGAVAPWAVDYDGYEIGFVESIRYAVIALTLAAVALLAASVWRRRQLLAVVAVVVAAASAALTMVALVYVNRDDGSYRWGMPIAVVGTLGLAVAIAVVAARDRRGGRGLDWFWWDVVEPFVLAATGGAAVVGALSPWAGWYYSFDEVEFVWFRAGIVAATVASLALFAGYAWRRNFGFEVGAAALASVAAIVTTIGLIRVHNGDTWALWGAYLVAFGSGAYLIAAVIAAVRGRRRLEPAPELGAAAGL